MTCPLRLPNFETAERWRLEQIVALMQGLDPVQLEEEKAEIAAKEEAAAQAKGLTMGELLDKYLEAMPYLRGRNRKPLKSGYVARAADPAQAVPQRMRGAAGARYPGGGYSGPVHGVPRQAGDAGDGRSTPVRFPQVGREQPVPAEDMVPGVSAAGRPR